VQFAVDALEVIPDCRLRADPQTQAGRSTVEVISTRLVALLDQRLQSLFCELDCGHALASLGNILGNTSHVMTRYPVLASDSMIGMKLSYIKVLTLGAAMIR
jgi:hypothetical protein